MVDATSVDDALARAELDRAEVLSIELADSEPLQYEPAGLPPTSAPRPVPNGAQPGLANVKAIGGAIFVGISSIFIAIGISNFVATPGIGSLVFSLFPLIHFSIGIGLLISVWSTWQKRRHIYANGIAATATIDRIGIDTTVKVNGRSPNEIEWTYYINDVPYHGRHSSMKLSRNRFREGDRIWILYDPNEPSESVEWPPISAST